MTSKLERQIPEALLAAQPLLLKNTILVPHEFGEGRVFRELSGAIYWIKRMFEEDETRRIVLRFNGPGGDTSDALACVDLIHAEAQDGTRIEGFLYGDNASAHSFVWAACPYRYTLPHATLGIHSVSTYFTQYTGHTDVKRAERELKRINERMAHIYADACDDLQWDFDYWMVKLEEYQRWTFNLYPEDLVNTYRMCELYDPVEYFKVQEETEEE